MIQSQVIIVGGGLAGLSAAIYLGRAKRETLCIDSGKSMARWEPDVQNYLGFPKGIDGEELLRLGKEQARRYHVRFKRDEILETKRSKDKTFLLKGAKATYECQRLLLATGIFHIPPDIPGIKPCLGHSLFFCKDCDGYRVHGKAVAVYGWANEAVEYALGMLYYSACVAIVTDGHEPRWDKQHARWIREYKIPVYLRQIVGLSRKETRLEALRFSEGTGLVIEALFTTRGDIYYNKLAQHLGAKINPDGEIVVDGDMRTTIPGLYAAGCVTPANCQMIIAAGQGATAAQAINRDLFVESLVSHSLRRVRERQMRKEKTRPVLRVKL
ncbi:MAG: NAD(P)/FAD-dependent oxidoreductase [Akkermansiaceae bacterium]|nr:NAD(P)/FAD-dependent oxidoreductase [Verrucomicrobiales bacterium]